MDDELLKPSVRPRSRLDAQPPYRLDSLFYPAFFGGVFAATGLAWIQARRLPTVSAERTRVLVWGLAGLVGLVIAALVVPVDGDSRSALRLSGRAVAVGVFLLQRREMRRAERLHAVRSTGHGHDSLWGPGIVAVLLGNPLQSLAIIVPGWLQT